MYSNVVPDKSGFLSRISSVDLLASNRQITLSKGGAITKAAYYVEETPTDIRITRSYEEGGQLFVDATIRGFETNNFRVVRYDAKTFTLLAENKNKVVNFIVPFKE